MQTSFAFIVIAVLACIGIVLATAGAGMDSPVAQSAAAAAARAEDGQAAYLGQPPPGRTPQVFAPGIVSTPDDLETSVIFSRDGKEAYWMRGRIGERATIMTARYVGGRWTRPEPLAFSRAGVFDAKPALSADGRLLLFTSTRPIDGRPDVNAVTHPVSTTGPSCLNIWYAERTANGWGEPLPFGPGVNTTADEDVPLASGDGRMFFIRSSPGGYGLFRYDLAARPRGDAEQVVAPVKGVVTWVAPDGSYLLYQGVRHDTPTRGIGVSFRRPDGAWSPGVSFGPELDAFGGFAPVLSPDGKYLFLMSDRSGNGDVYWVDASVIDKLRAAAVK